MTNLILALVAISIFVIYNAVAIHFFGIPKSLSETFYLYQNKRSGLGYIFTGMMFTVALTLMPAWIEITEVISTWSHYLTVLPFLGAGMIAFVGAAPAFRSCELESKVHTISATAAAVFSLLWCAVVCYKIAYIIPISAVIVWSTAFATKTQKKAQTYWWEMVAFLATFTTIVTECIILL
jgi:hypothetical protein